MQETTKTKIFVASAALLVLAAIVSHFVNQPRAASDFADVGKPFYEDFTSSDQAQSLEVFSMDPETATLKRFKVAKVDGLWRIPSHENYPAEAAARLATTATSVIGIERASLAGRRASEHQRLGVVDPLSEDLDDPESAGQRIRLMDESESVVVDFIIGKQVEDVVVADEDRAFQGGDNRQTYYYVRRADESQTYTVPLRIDLSTKFSDWIDPDLLRVEAADIETINVRNYTLEEAVSGNPLMPQRALTKKTGDTLDLTKSGPSSWQLAGVDEAKETFSPAPVSALVRTLDELKIVDVRRKATFMGKQMLTADLELNQAPEFKESPQQFNQAIQGLVSELESKGFSLAGNAKKLELVSDNGEIAFGTRDGALYTLQIGSAFEEDSQEIKVAGAESSQGQSEGEGSKDGKEAADKSDDVAETDAVEDANEAFDDTDRYMLVRVKFDPSLLSNQPTEPVEPAEPTKPADYEPLAEEPSEEEAEPVEPADEKSKDEKAADDDSNDESDDEEKKPERDPASEAYDAAVVAFEQAKVDYELAKTRYADDKKRFDERVAEGEKLVAELNERFGEWYYVISGQNLKALQLTRKELVTAKEQPEPPADELALPDRPDISFEGGPAESVKEQPSEPAQESGAEE